MRIFSQQSVSTKVHSILLPCVAGMVGGRSRGGGLGGGGKVNSLRSSRRENLQPTVCEHESPQYLTAMCCRHGWGEVGGGGEGAK